MATYVLVHGGGHGGWCYQRVARLLREAGHEVHAPSLTGLGERSHLVSPQVDLDTHIRDITSLLYYEDLTDVILAGHSYGGMVVTGVADRAADRVGRLVYLDAANPENGQSLAMVAPASMSFARQIGKTVDDVELVLLPEAIDVGTLYGITNPDDAAWVSARLTPHPWKCFEQPLALTDEAAYRAIPQYHVVCTSTVATRDPAFINEARAAGRLWEIDTGHDLMLTEPQKVADALLQVAATAQPG